MNTTVDSPNIKMNGHVTQDQSSQNSLWAYRSTQMARYHFTLMLAEGWFPRTVTPIAPSRDSESRLVEFRHEADESLSFCVTAIQLPREISTDRWLALMLRTRFADQDASIQADSTPRGETIQHQAVCRTNETYHHFRVVKDANGLFLIEATCGAGIADRCAEDLQRAVKTFHLLNPTSDFSAEDLNLVSRAAPLDFRCYLPQSWTIQEAIDQNRRVRWMRLSQAVDDRCLGCLHLITAIADQFASPEVMIDQFLAGADLERATFMQGELNSVETLPGAKASWQLMNSGERIANRSADFESAPCRTSRLTIHQFQQGWMLLANVTDDLTPDEYFRSVSQRAFEIVQTTWRV